jgi:hypothetical protein
MPRVFKQSYTRAIPANAQPTTTSDGKPAVRWKGRDKR